MPASYNRLSVLIFKHLTGELTTEEKEELEQLLKNPAKRDLFNELTNLDKLAEAVVFAQQVDTVHYRNIIEKKIAQQKVIRKRRTLYSWAAAAVVTVAAATGVWYLASRSTASPTLFTESFLLLSDNHKILLSRLPADTVIEGSLQITKQGHEIAYKLNTTGEGQSVYHRLYVESGKNYMLILPDNSRVSLGESTTFNFPIRFNGQERTVSISGKASFDVNQQEGSTFKAIMVSNALDTGSPNRLEAKALGTTFSVRAYPQEEEQVVKLDSGHLVIYRKKDSLHLYSGQQATIRPRKKLLKDTTSIPAEASVQTSGQFDFRNTELKTVMDVLAYWYDIKVTYQGQVEHTKINFIGNYRLSLEEIIGLLEFNHIKVNRNEGQEINLSLAITTS